jgi:hypothetical protein
MYRFRKDNKSTLFPFQSSFHDLSLILTRDEERRTRVSTSTSTPMFTTPDQQYTVPDSALFRTPEQDQKVLLERMSVVEDSPHSTESNRSAKREHHTASFANQFLRATYFSLEEHLEQKAWFKDKSRLGLVYKTRLSVVANSHTERSKRWKSKLANPK